VRAAREITTSSTPFDSTPWPLTGNVWTQAAGETELLLGVAQVRLPTACDSQEQYGGYAYVNVLIDGEFVGSGYVGFYPNGPRTQRVGLYFYPLAALMAPDSDSTHVAAARVYDTCTGADQNFTFTSFQLDVVGAS
jgi:hypothetical protein